LGYPPLQPEVSDKIYQIILPYIEQRDAIFIQVSYVRPQSSVITRKRSRAHASDLAVGQIGRYQWLF
jgi:hypothetical protein